GGHVEIVDQDRPAAGLNAHRQMATVGDIAEPAALDRLDRTARNGGDAVIALLAVDLDMAVAQRMKAVERKELVGTLRLLQAQHVRRALQKQALDDRHAQPHGVDVPGGYREGHGGSGGESKAGTYSHSQKRQGRAW